MTRRILKHLLDETCQVIIENEKEDEMVLKIPYFKTALEFQPQHTTQAQSDSLFECPYLYFPLTMEADLKSIKLFLDYFMYSKGEKEEKEEKDEKEEKEEKEEKKEKEEKETRDKLTFLFNMNELCQLLKISFSLGCTDLVDFFSKEIADMFSSLDMDELFGIPITREFFEQSKNEEWKKTVQDNLLSRSNNVIQCLYNLPDFLKKKIRNSF